MFYRKGRSLQLKRMRMRMCPEIILPWWMKILKARVNLVAVHPVKSDKASTDIIYYYYVTCSEYLDLTLYSQNGSL